MSAVHFWRGPGRRCSVSEKRSVAVHGEEEPVGHDGGEGAPEIVFIHRIEKGGGGRGM